MAFGGSYRSKMSEETFDFLCTTCAEDNKTVEAIKFCVQCCNYCCQSCVDAHKKFSAFRNHSLLDVDQGQQAGGQQPRFLEVPIQRCREHKTKVVDMYCEFHDEVGCSDCFFSDHQDCKKSHIHSIPETIDAIFKSKDCEQTYSQLKDVIVSMDTVSNDKDARLQKLIKARNEALNDVDSSEKMLATILKKTAESSRQNVQTVYKQLETEVLEEKQSVTNTSHDLQTTKDKIDRSESNRSERLVNTKIAETQLKQAASLTTSHYQQRHPDVELSFTPDQPLVEYMKSLQDIGQVQRQKLYKIKSSRDISIKHSNDSNPYVLSFCCLTHDNQLLVTDENNRKLKRFDTNNMSLLDYCTLDSLPYGICCISDDEVAVSCQAGNNKIQFVNIGKKMRPTRQIKMDHDCYGIAYNDGNIYVTDVYDSLYVYDINGSCLKEITQDSTGRKLFSMSSLVTLNDSRDRIYVGDWDKGLVCLDVNGNYLSTLTDTGLVGIRGACVDGRGNMFVVGFSSRNVVQFDENGKKVGVIVNASDGLKFMYPLCVSFDKKLNRLYVTMWKSDVVKMYELE